MDNLKKSLLNCLHINSYAALFCLLLLIAGQIYFAFPDQIMPDTVNMMGHIKTLRFVDNLPHFSILLWHYLDKIVEGPFLYQLLQLLLLWAACLYGFAILKGNKIRLFFLAIPFIPSIFHYSGHVLKDTIIITAYMLVAMDLSYHTIYQKPLSFKRSLILLFGVMYGTMAKVQALYFYPLIILWVVFCYPPLSLKKGLNLFYKAVAWIILSLSMYYGMIGLNNALIEKSVNNYYWQYVKIYDLAGMSVFANQIYVPEFLFKRPDITVKDIEDHYDYLWEPLIAQEDSPLIKTQNDEQRSQLLEVWKESVKKDPVSYLKHRTRNWIKILGGSHIKGLYIDYFKDSPQFLKYAKYLSLLSFLPLFPVFLYYLYLGIRYFNRSLYAPPVFFLSSMGIALIFIVYIFTLAAAARYILFSAHCFFFATPFAYMLRQEKAKL